MSVKAKLKQKVKNDIGGVITDLGRFFEDHPNSDLQTWLKDAENQYDALILIIDRLPIEQRKWREKAIQDTLIKIIDQITDDPPKYIWYVSGIITLMVCAFLGNDYFQNQIKHPTPSIQRDTFQFWMGSDTINYVVNDGINAMVKEINEVTNGRLTLELHRNTNRSEAPNLLRQVSEGKKVQMFHSISYYWNQSLPASLFFSAVPFGMSRDEMDTWLVEDGYRLWRNLYQRDSIIPFALGNTGEQWGGWFNKEIHTLKDFNGLTMRMGGEGSKILHGLGVTITGLVPNVADLDSFFRHDPTHKAFEWIGPYTDYKIGLHKYFKYYYQEGWHEPNTLYSLYINQAAWNRVKDIHPVLESTFQKYHHQISATFHVKNEAYRQKLISEKGKDLIQHFPCALIKELEIKSEKHMKDYFFEHQKSYLMDSISKSYFEFHKKHKKDKPFPTCK